MLVDLLPSYAGVPASLLSGGLYLQRFPQMDSSVDQHVGQNALSVLGHSRSFNGWVKVQFFVVVCIKDHYQLDMYLNCGVCREDQVIFIVTNHKTKQNNYKKIENSVCNCRFLKQITQLPLIEVIVTHLHTHATSNIRSISCSLIIRIS